MGENVSGVVHIQARRSAACHALAKHTAPQSDWKVESENGFSNITSAQMRERLERTDHPLGLTFAEDAKDIHIRAVELPKEMHGQGIGTQLYMQAIKYARDSGLGFRSDISPSPEAVAVYGRLVEMGIPVTQQSVEGGDGKSALQFSISADALQNTELKDMGGQDA
tara:strand:+ start:544 stop:1041 length:498 start_codon:yes stop_codon:yes gene_type:complete